MAETYGIGAKYITVRFHSNKLIIVRDFIFFIKIKVNMDLLNNLSPYFNSSKIKLRIVRGFLAIYVLRDVGSNPS